MLGIEEVGGNMLMLGVKTVLWFDLKTSIASVTQNPPEKTKYTILFYWKEIFVCPHIFPLSRKIQKSSQKFCENIVN